VKREAARERENGLPIGAAKRVRGARHVTGPPVVSLEPRKQADKQTKQTLEAAVHRQHVSIASSACRALHFCGPDAVICLLAYDGCLGVLSR
jgi:hypothetical protein